MFKDFDVNIIDNYLKEKFPIVLEFEFDGLMLLIGGTIKDLMMGKKNSRDIDFTLLTQKKGNLDEFIKKYQLNVIATITNGCAIKYNDTYICIKTLNDLYYSGHLSTDYLFYDIKRKQLIPIGIKKCIEKNTITDYCYKGYYKPKRRLKKAKEFLYYLNGNKKPKVKRKYNLVFNLFLSFIKHPTKLFKRSS